MQGRGHHRLIEIYDYVRSTNEDYWIGLNCLDLEAKEVFAAVPMSVSGIWVDDAGIDEDDTTERLAKDISVAREQSGWRGLYFGGVAFKYQKPVVDLKRVAKVAAKYMDVVTTSGPATGQPAGVEKIRVMKRALGGKSLAVASGISPENVRMYLGSADCFLVATSLLVPGTEDFNGDRVRALMQMVRG